MSNGNNASPMSVIDQNARLSARDIFQKDIVPCTKIGYPRTGSDVMGKHDCYGYKVSQFRFCKDLDSVRLSWTNNCHRIPVVCNDHISKVYNRICLAVPVCISPWIDVRRLTPRLPQDGEIRWGYSPYTPTLYLLQDHIVKCNLPNMENFLFRNRKYFGHGPATPVHRIATLPLTIINFSHSSTTASQFTVNSHLIIGLVPYLSRVKRGRVN